MHGETKLYLIGSFEEERAHLEWFIEQMRALIRSSQFEMEQDFSRYLTRMFRDRDLRIKSLRALHFSEWLMSHTGQELKNIERMIDDMHYEEGRI